MFGGLVKFMVFVHFDVSENVFPVYFRRSRNFKFSGRCLEILEITVEKTSALLHLCRLKL